MSNYIQNMAKSKRPAAAKQSWVVTLTVTVEKEIVTEPCTQDEACNSPYDHAIDERELQQLDWQVTSVKPNE